MTLLKPSLRVCRLVVLQGSHRAFDCEFHSGVNVVRGRNSSGKTTIMDLLAYSLGAENIRWKPQALECSSTMVEVALNGSQVTLLREISSETQRPLLIYWGRIDLAFDAGPAEWERYPFKRSEQKISFSQALFGALELPLAQGQGASNLTMHQLLRVLYADQPSVHSPIFRMDTFDSALTREMIGGYLCGVYNDDLYSAQLRVREVSKELDKKTAELRGIFSVLGRSGQAPDIEASKSAIPDLEDKRDELTRYIEDLKSTRVISRKEKTQAVSKSDSLRTQLNSAKRYESTLKDALAIRELDILDSRLFIEELKLRLNNLDESKETRQYFGDVSFQFCPSCLAEIKVDDAAHSCHLCKSTADGNGDIQLLRMRNELSIQIKESSSLMVAKEAEVQQLRNDIPLATKEVRRLEKEYGSVASSWSSEIETILEQTGRALGALDEEIRQAYEKQKLFAVIGELQKKRDALSKEFNELNELVESLEAGQESRKLEVSRVLEKNMIRLLKQDLPLQLEFINPHSVSFDFVENSVYVNGSRNFSESSAVVLRHVFHLALLSTSLELPFMRVPRYLMLDGIDDGGMEKDRSHNLQKIIVNECNAFKSEFQLIFATSEINPEFENTDLVVSRYFNPEARSLDIR
ncbi:AAA family ATPase [Pseudomonas sp. B1(2018)]|uniref:ATP-binding protein n=1 Tax=Pseudomonas sp. B1(2018) TaxID=2233856 RepID=UPI000D5D5881|nr:ATP-binding protein [Pseudomonas sp. B1(2018)]PVZ59229.1 AAA family ATPase [Pseudomonas sp. B1(2018)]